MKTISLIRRIFSPIPSGYVLIGWRKSKSGLEMRQKDPVEERKKLVEMYADVCIALNGGSKKKVVA